MAVFCRQRYIETVMRGTINACMSRKILLFIEYSIRV